jgi:two-component system, NarL family, invasion response regulator UvrY
MLRAIERICQGDTFVSPYLTSRAEASSAADDRLAELSPRDRRIVELLGDGRSLSEISYELGQSYKIVANVTNMIRGKLGLRTNAALIKLAVERRLERLPEAGTPNP